MDIDTEVEPATSDVSNAESIHMCDYVTDSCQSAAESDKSCKSGMSTYIIMLLTVITHIVHAPSSS